MISVRRLYRETHATFEAYCRERWGWSRQHAYRQIQAAQVAGMSPMGDKPANERQARAMLDTKPAQQKRPSAERAAQITKLAPAAPRPSRYAAGRAKRYPGAAGPAARGVASQLEVRLAPRSLSRASRDVGNPSTAALQQPRSSGSASVSIMCAAALRGAW